ncbi:hypothetical protein ACQVP2_22525 [Methylobacterium aquaticum]|uniref:hypothetical protein n=1 Tax=Methylobacterium aquaticum TaxID=270351 RepID=UPI003D16D667
MRALDDAGTGPVLAKPPYGSPCNNCGQCCRLELCPLGHELFGTWDGPCPAHERTADGFGCGLVLNPQRYRPARAMARGRTALSQAAVRLIGSGAGCDALGDGEQPDPRERARFQALLTQMSSREIRRAKILWGAGGR